MSGNSKLSQGSRGKQGLGMHIQAFFTCFRVLLIVNNVQLGELPNAHDLQVIEGSALEHCPSLAGRRVVNCDDRL